MSGAKSSRESGGEASDRIDASQTLLIGRRVLHEEGAALAALADALDRRFVDAVRWIHACRGRVLVTGLGKSGLVARKIAATLTSTGTPAMFVHPVEALHGDLGIATSDDLLLSISRSGRNEEILSLASTLHALGVRNIAVCADADSPLAHAADLLLHTPFEREACPLQVTPTTSTTLALALGDALAMALLTLRGFRREDFAVFHPSGALGRALRTTVAELMHAGEELPSVRRDASLRQALVEMAAKRLGCVCVLGADGSLVGFLTDGDLRRVLLREDAPLEHPVERYMSMQPHTVEADCLARAALQRMEANPHGAITQLVVVEQGRPVGVLHLHDILRRGYSA
jgi:arabinose-5-phosphate isomerase